MRKIEPQKEIKGKWLNENIGKSEIFNCLHSNLLNGRCIIKLTL